MKYPITIILTAILSILSTHAGDAPQNQAIESKLEIIILPDINFKNTPLCSTLEKVQKLSRASDPETNATKKGVNIVLKMQPEQTDAVFITARLERPTLGQVFAEIAKQAKCKIIVEQYAVAIVPQDN